MTGTSLYTAVSQALETLCPAVTQMTTLTYCSTDSQVIDNIPYIDGNAIAQGELVVTVESSGYNATSLRDAMIQSAALTVQNAAAGNNCYTQEYEVEVLRRRDGMGIFGWLLSLYKRDTPHPEPATIEFCNTVGFAGVGYYGPFWHVDDGTNPTAWIYPHWEFTVGPGGDFLCHLLMDVVDLFAVVQPEFAIGGVGLGEAVDLLCMDEIDDEAS
jgi:hypothetical protein